ncbi:GNAT family N-acetyltransferase [Aestuariibius sp. 2305UL40-4]|uniref:GNAT family N-acetyltransferase n=1 Tax=Aestuariibius violaceus TaxID=3234132 RepID=UPI00345E98C0
MSEPIIRPASLGDFGALLELYSELTGGLPVLDGNAGRVKLQEILEHEGTYLFGAEVSGKLVSVATLHICPNLTFGGRSYARIENVVTLASYRGQGLSKQVMEHAIETARSKNVVSIILLTGKGLEARGFYEKCGFNAEEKWGMILKF